MSYSDSILIHGFQPFARVYPIKPPGIPTGFAYQFTTSSGLVYEVQFARKENMYSVLLNFTVLNDEFDSDYPVTNRGEMYSVVSTVLVILSLFYEQHPLTTSFEFSGEHKEKNDTEDSSIRTRMYFRTAKRYINSKWEIDMIGNRVFIRKRK